MISAITSIEIYNPYGNAYYANADKSSVEFPITDQCERSAKVMGEDFVRLQFKLKDRVTFDAFSFIEYDNQTFFLREQYIPTPNGTYYTYDIKFVSVANMLDKHVCYRHVKVTGAGEWYEPEININGTLDTMYVIVMGSIQRAAEQFKDIVYGQLLSTIYTNGMASDGINPNYSKVKITANTDLLTFNFSGDNIANVCTTIANNYTNDNKKDTEWYITEEHGASPDLTQLTLHFAKCQGDEDKLQEFSDYVSKDNGAYAFAHPYITGGLRKVEYAQAWSGITNVIIPYGSDRNMAGQSVKGIDDITKLQSTFGKRLRLDIYDEEGNPKTYKVIDKDGKEQEIAINEQGGIRNDFVNTGIEQVKFFDEVYPQAHFQVKEVTTKNKRQDGQIVPEYTIQAVALDNEGKEMSTALLPDGFFPLQIEEGTTLSVRFESGLLNGREFEIANKTKSDMVYIEGEEKREYSLIFTIVADGSIEDGTLIPSGNFKPRAGDKFALFNMKMPDVYVELAQQELAQKAYEELVKIQTTRPEVKCSSDPTNFNGQMALGGVVAIRSELFNSEGNEFKSRIISYSYKLTKTTDVQFSLASAIMQGTLSTMNDLIADVTHATGGLDQRTINLSRRAWRDATEMAEMLDSLKAEMLLVGEEKFQFAFSSAIQCVHENNAFVGLEVSAGTMQHTQEPYINYNNGGFWGIGYVLLNQDEAGNPLKADTPYYVYAKVEDTEYAEIVLNENAYSNEIGKDEPYLMLGILSSEFEGKRIFNRTNGFTQIAGGTITTEQVQDAGRSLIIDFQRAEIIARKGAKISGNIEFELQQPQIDSIVEKIGEIGGENLFRAEDWADWGFRPSYFAHKLRSDDLQAGKYVMTGKVYSLYGGCAVMALYDDGTTESLFSNSYQSDLSASATEDNLITKGVGITLDFSFTMQKDGYVYIVPAGSVASESFRIALKEVMLQKGDRATAYQPWVNYLTKALQGQTSVAGGLLATSVILLRDGEEVTAGMSGVKDDNILLFGGGSYDEAVNAAVPDNDFHVGENKTGRQITSLLKKDGQGKIGIYKIDDTKAVVDVHNQGKVIIDASTANGGIFIHDKDDAKRIIISPKTISDSGYMPKNVDVLSGTKNGSSSVNGSTSTYTATTTLTLFSKSIDYDGTLNLSTLNISISGINTIVSGMTSMNYTSATIVAVDIKVKNVTNTTSIGSFSTLKGETSGSINISSKEISVQKGTVEIQLVISSRIVGTSLERPTDCSFSYSSNLSSELVPLYNSKTIICKDGIISAYDSRRYFMVQNTSNGQKIYAKGLSDGTDREEGSGELYNSNALLNVFGEFLTELDSVFSDVQFVGSNKEYAKNISTKIDNLKKKITETALIASS